ncbi:MAG TPA: Holliday junction resolvase RuvX [Gammaproteobacteria bacterium]|nr:Holliday junction resolvase RuvX [Gammaproteobacteria bacterium]
MTACRTLLAFDFGSKKIGIAVGQELTRTARPLTILRNIGGKPDWAGITRLIDEWRPDALVVGLPLNMDGTGQDMTRAAKRFANQLQGRYHLPVFQADERLSTRAAQQMIRERGGAEPREGVDALAAQLILETFFGENPPGET